MSTRVGSRRKYSLNGTKILGSQIKWIEDHCGKEAADGANYGWFIDDVEGTYATKVYGHGVLTTDVYLRHMWEDF